MQLYTPNEIDKFQQDLPFLIEIMEWVRNFLGRHHHDLGRPGPVCPFVPPSLKSNTIRMAVVRSKNLDLQQIEEIVFRYRDMFLEIKPRDREAALNKAFLLIFPDVELEDTSRLIDGVQQKLKPLFVEAGLMIGEFHKRNESPGLHNPNFRPLRSPIPILAIRFMVEADLPFLQGADDPRLRIKYLKAYLQLFENKFKDESKLIKALQALALAQEQVEEESVLKI